MSELSPDQASHGPFDPDDLVRWAETYGDPEWWANRAQQLHRRLEDADRRHVERMAPVVEALADARDEVERLREDYDALLELAAAAVRGHTRAIHALAGNLEYPQAERRAYGTWLSRELQAARRKREA